MAEAGGYLVELYLWLRRHGRPLTNWDRREIRDAAEENLRRVERLRERDNLSAEDRQWLEARAQAERAAKAIVRSASAGAA